MSDKERKEINLVRDSEAMLHTGSIHGRLEPITEDPEDLEDLEEAPSLMVPSAETPRYSALLKKLNSAEDLTILDDLASFTVHDKLLYKRPYGSAEQRDDEPYALAERFEHLLRVTDEEPAAGPNKNLGFWAFVGNNLFDGADCSSAVRPASQLELETFESQKRGFAHAHRKTCAIPNSCEQFSTVSPSKPAPQHQLSLTTNEPCAGVTSFSPTRASCFIHG